MLRVGTVTLLLAGCSRPQQDSVSSQVVLKDSLGVSVVMNSDVLPRDFPVWGISERPVLQVPKDSADDDVIVHWIRAAARLSDGRIVMLSESARQLLFLSREGRLIGTAGREGDGPGEFRRPFGLMRLKGDTMVIADRRSHRLTWVGPEGGLVRQVTPPPEKLRSVVPEGEVVGMPQYLAPGYVVAEAHRRGLPRPGERTRSPQGYVIVGPNGEARYLGGFRAMEQYYESERNGRYAFFANRTVMALGVEPPRLYIGETDPFEVRVFDPSGELVRIIRDDLPPTAITDRDISWERWELLDWAEQSGRIEELTRLADAMPIPDHKPAFEALIVDTEGYLWAKEYSSYEPSPVRYRVYAPNGVRVGTAMLPGRLQVFEIGKDYILGVEWDLDYIETLKMYALHRPGA